jgi:hypothetical protein
MAMSESGIGCHWTRALIRGVDYYIPGGMGSDSSCCVSVSVYLLSVMI